MTRAPTPPRSLVRFLFFFFLLFYLIPLPSQVWCGGDAVACHWERGEDKERLVLLIGTICLPSLTRALTLPEPNPNSYALKFPTG